MFNIKALAVATAISAGLAFAMPVASQAMPVGPVKIQTANDSNVVAVHYKNKKHWRKNHKWREGRRWRESRRWRHNRRFARYCDPWDGCYRRRHARYYRSWNEPYYDDGYGYPYYGGNYGPGFYGPGIGLYFRFD